MKKLILIATVPALVLLAFSGCASDPVTSTHSTHTESVSSPSIFSPTAASESTTTTTATRR